jgi:hypothetical protein
MPEGMSEYIPEEAMSKTVTIAPQDVELSDFDNIKPTYVKKRSTKRFHRLNDQK